MISVSNAFKDACRDSARDVVTAVYVEGTINGVATSYWLDDKDIIDYTVTFPFSTNDLPTIGQVYGATLRMKIRGDTIPASFWKDATDTTFTVAPGLRFGTPPSPYACQVGLFLVKSRKSNDNFATYEIEATDRTTLLDVKVDASTTGWDANSRVPGLHFPYQYYADLVVGELLSACGLVLDGGYTFPTDSNGNRLIILHPSAYGIPTDLTARQYLGMIGGIFGANGMMTNSGTFIYKRYEDVSGDSRDKITLSMQYMGGLIRDREDPQYQFKGYYSYGGKDPNPTGITPTDFDGVLYLPSDDLVSVYTSHLPHFTVGRDTFIYYSNDFKTTFYDSGYYFVGGEINYRGMPWLECGDVVDVEYEYNGTLYTSKFAIMDHTLDITGGMRGTMRCITPLIAEVDTIVGGGGSFTSASEAIASGALLAKFGVGSVVMTDSNTNPQDSLGGTWTLIDKEFISQSRTATVSQNTTNFSALSVTAIYDSHTITFVGSMTSSVSITGTNLEVLTQTLTNNGASALASAIPFTGYCDSAHAIVLMDIGTDGRVRTLDVVVRGTGTSVTSGNTFNWSVTCPCAYTDMEDGFCDKFYWQRTA